MDVRDLAFIDFHHIDMMFFPEAWASAPDMNLAWVDIDFPPCPRSGIPKQPGVYAFVVEPHLFSLPPANGLFYIGKATNLYQRIGSYIHENGIDFSVTSRPYVWRMLNLWKGSLRYYYSTTDDVAQAENIEKEMIKALLPPFNRQLDAETSHVMRAFQ